MSMLRNLAAGLLNLFRKEQVERELDEELRSYLDNAVQEKVRAGMSREEALRTARIELGNVESVKESVRSAGWERFVEDFWQDIRYGARALAKNPGFTLVAVLTLALGIGATTAIFSLVSAVLLRPLPYEDADELFVIYGRHKEHGGGSNVSYPDYLTWKSSQSFEGVGIFNWYDTTLSGLGPAERMPGAQVSANLFPLLGVGPLLGRTFTEQESAAGGGRVVILGHGLWQRLFGSDPGALGRSITLDGSPHTVVGVMPPGFRFPYRGEIWTPLVPEPQQRFYQHGNRFLAAAVARLRSGASRQQGEAELAAISRRLEAEHPESNLGWDAQLVAMRDDIVGDLGPALLLIFAAVGLVLLAVCGNVANLLLARGAARQRELAVRRAIGAGRGRLVRQLTTESLLLAALGGTVGVALAFWAGPLFGAALADRLPSYSQVTVDNGVLLFAAIVTTAASLLFGLVPALSASAASTEMALKEATRSSVSARGSLLRASLVAGEVAFAVMLLAGGLLLIRSVTALSAIETGFDARGILTARVYLADPNYAKVGDRVRFLNRLLERLAALPGVEVAGAAQGTPFSGWNVGTSFSAEGLPPPLPGQEPSTHFQWVTPEFFKVLRVPLLSGRALLPSDDQRAPAVCVVNAAFVEEYFPNENPLGRKIKLGGEQSDEPWTTIVGVVQDFRHYRLTEPMRPAVYLPHLQWTPRQMTLTIRAATSPADFAPTLRHVLAELDPDVPAYRVATLEETLARQTWVQRIQRDVLAAFAIVVVFLALLGLYGVISYAVLQRHHEIGIRLALGATPGHVSRLILRQGAWLAMLGITIGTPAAFAAARLLAGTLYEVEPGDPITYIVAGFAVALLAIGASYLPARRASRLEPLAALRHE